MANVLMVAMVNYVHQGRKRIGPNPCEHKIGEHGQGRAFMGVPLFFCG